MLTDEIYQLSEKSNKSAYEMDLMRVKVDTLNAMNIDGLHLSIDETKGVVVETKDSIYGVIEALKKQAEMAAIQDILTESYKAFYQATIDNKTATDNYKVASDRLAEAQNKLNEKAAELDKKNQGVSGGFRDVANWISQKLSPEYRTLKKKSNMPKTLWNSHARLLRTRLLQWMTQAKRRSIIRISSSSLKITSTI